MVMKGKKGAAFLIFGLMIALFGIIYAVIIIPAFTDVLTEARDADHLNCTDPALSTGTRITCIGVDLYLPTFVMGVLMAALSYVFIKEITSG